MGLNWDSLQKMSNELVNYAVEKGTPVLQKSADTIKEKVIKVSKEVIEKLEKETPKEEKHKREA